MRAMVCHDLSRDRSGLVFEEAWPEPPRPGDGEVTLAVSHAALNYPDLLMLSGEYQFVPALPFIPGLEASGVVVAVGAGVDAAVLGSEVVVGARAGLLAERITLPASAIRHRPVALDPPSAAAFTVAALTAYVALLRRGRLSPGERVLVVGAGSGTGLAAVAMAKALGAWVVATASTVAKVDAARAAGADQVHLVPRGGPFPLIDGVDLIFDPVGGLSAATILQALHRGGRYLIVGFVGGIPTFDFETINCRGVEVSRRSRRRICPARSGRRGREPGSDRPPSGRSPSPCRLVRPSCGGR